MKRMLKLELKRIFSARATRWVCAATFLMAVLLAVLVLSFERYTVVQNGVPVQLRGPAALQARAETDAQFAGDITPAKLREVWERYAALHAEYGDEIPDVLYYEEVYPTAKFVDMVRWAYRDADNNLPQVEDITGEMAAAYYERRAEMQPVWLYAQLGRDDAALQKALHMEGEVPKPFYYASGAGTVSNASDYLGIVAFLAVLPCAFLAAPAFAGEYENGAAATLLCTRYGRRRLAGVKLAAALLATLGLYAVCVGVYAVLVLAVAGTAGLRNAAQLIVSVFEPLALSVGGMNALALAGYTLAFLAVVCFVLFLSSRVQNPMAVLAVGAGVALLPTVLRMVGGGTVGAWLHCLLPSGGIGLANNLFYSLASASFLPLGPLRLWAPGVTLVAAAVQIPLYLWLALRGWGRRCVKA